MSPIFQLSADTIIFGRTKISATDESALYAGFGAPAQAGADDGATPPEPDAEALIRLAQQLCEGLGLQQTGGMHSRMRVVDSARPFWASAEAAPCWRAADTNAAMAPAAASPAAPVPQPDSSAMLAEQPHCVADSAVGSSADDDVDSLDALLARTQLGPPSLQRLAAEALLPGGMKPQVHAAHQLHSFSSPTAACGALHASGGSSLSLAHAMAPSSTQCSSTEASPGCGVCKSSGFVGVPSSRPDSAPSSSGCSICAARQRHAHHTAGALQSGGQAQAIRSPVTRRCVSGRTATADCSAQTVNTADAASGASLLGMMAAAAAHTASRKRKPAAMSGAKRLCVPASSGATRPTQPAQSDAAAAAAADLPWSEQLRRQQARRQPPVGKAQPETAGAAAAVADGLPDSPRHPQEQVPAPAEGDLNRRMSALEAKVASWSLPQVCSDLSMVPQRTSAELA